MGWVLQGPPWVLQELLGHLDLGPRLCSGVLFSSGLLKLLHLQLLHQGLLRQCICCCFTICCFSAICCCGSCASQRVGCYRGLCRDTGSGVSGAIPLVRGLGPSCGLVAFWVGWVLLLWLGSAPVLFS